MYGLTCSSTLHGTCSSIPCAACPAAGVGLHSMNVELHCHQPLAVEGC